MEYEISVIIPIYNGEKYIKNSIESVINQTLGFENIELILVDDNSNDNSKNIIRHYSNKYDNCKPIFLDKNSGGPGKPRNIGIKQASGKNIMLLDMDDEYENNACEIALSKIQKYDAEVIFFNFFEIDIYQNPQKKIGYSITNEINIKRPFSKNNLNTIYSIQVAPWDRIMKKEFIINNDLKFLEDSVHEDVTFLIDTIAKLNEVIIIPNTLYKHNINRTSLSNTNSLKNFKSQIKGLKKINKSLKNQNDIKPEEYMEPFILSWIQDFISSYNDFNKNEKNEILTDLYNFQKELDYTIIMRHKIGKIINNNLLKQKFNTVILYCNIIGFFYSKKIFRSLYNKFI